MKKCATTKKLSLNRETLRLLELEKNQLEAVAGGATVLCNTHTACGASGCVNTCFC
jgi:hypothetical protein